MIKREEIANPNSCLNKAAEDEPLFVFRAHDATSDLVVAYWLQLNQDTLAPEKAAHAVGWIKQAQAWPDRKRPD